MIPASRKRKISDVNILPNKKSRMTEKEDIMSLSEAFNRSSISNNHYLADSIQHLSQTMDQLVLMVTSLQKNESEARTVAPSSSELELNKQIKKLKDQNFGQAVKITTLEKKVSSLELEIITIRESIISQIPHNIGDSSPRWESYIS
jgi:hypothetical protein